MHRLDQGGTGELGQRLAHREPVDAVRLREFGLTRQLGAARQLADRDPLLQVAGELAVQRALMTIQ